MKKLARKAFSTLKVLFLLTTAYYIINYLFLGVSISNPETGKKLVYWSGIKSYFSADKEEVAWVFNDYPAYKTEGADGPHIFYSPEGTTAYRVTTDNQLTEEKVGISDSLLCVLSKQEHFYFRLQEGFHSPVLTDSASRILAISDIEGNFAAFSGLLKENKVMDDNFNWTYGKGRLVLLGDFMDRGEQVTQCLWLIYKLEQEALQQGGRVHYLLGNHEIMNLQGNASYVAPKYLGLAQSLSGRKDLSFSLQHLYSKETELGRWLRSKKTVQQINNILFVHAGLSPELLEHRLSLADINKLITAEIEKEYEKNEPVSQKTAFLLGPKGPLWYRGLVRATQNYHKATQPAFEKILHYYQASHMVIGHSLVNSISTDYQGRLIRIDTEYSQKKSSGESHALLIEGGVFYTVDDTGRRQKLN